MRARDLIKEVARRDRLAFLGGLLNLTLAAGMMIALALDDRTILGISAWIKPLKFAGSIALYLWTIAWLLGELPGPRWGKRLVSAAASAAMVVEIVCIAGQSLRGTTSHYNGATAFDGAVFSLMGLMIIINTLAALLLLALFARRLSLPRAYLWGIRVGLAVFVVGSLEAIAMVSNGAHTVGAPDGGPGLPLLNWSTRAGDLRVAHFLGLHALQAFPLAGWILSRRLPLSPSAQAAGLTAFAALYLGAMAFLFRQALHGRAFLAL